MKRDGIPRRVAAGIVFICGGHAMRRRDFLASGLAFTTAQATGLQSRSVFAAGAAPVKRVIDAHCHVFNARDLPIEGFAIKVLIPRMKELRTHFAKYPNAFIVLVRALSTIMQEEAPVPSTEMFLVEKIQKGSKAPSDDDRKKEDLASIEKALKKIWSKDILKQLRFKDGFAANVAIETLQRLLIVEFEPKAFDFKNSEEVSAYIAAYDRKKLARYLYDEGIQKPLGRNVRWALLFGRNRFELVDQLQKFHGKRSVMLTPSIVDLSKWLEDDKHSDIEAQVAVMSRLSLRGSGPRVHGFVGFDPLRQAFYEQKGGAASAEPMRIVKRAIEENGFIGIKLYPPMGFRPINNAGAGTDFPDHVRKVLGDEPGAKLDAALTELYAWCSERHVPVLAHAANSNQSGPGYGTRAHPKYWIEALKKYPDLRICMAHFGGFSELGDPNKESNTWEWAIGNFMKPGNRPFAYADLSYFNEILVEDVEVLGVKIRDLVLKRLTNFKSSFGNCADYLMYGTDWTMVGREAGFIRKDKRANPDVVADFLHAAGFSDDEIDKIMFRNAVRFMGLSKDDREKGARGRLEAFYAANKQSADWMKVFD